MTHDYMINFCGTQPQIYDIDDLLKQAYEDGFAFSTLAVAPDLKDGLRHALLSVRPLEPGHDELLEVKRLTSRWGAVDILVDDALPAHFMHLR